MLGQSAIESVLREVSVICSTLPPMSMGLRERSINRKLLQARTPQTSGSMRERWESTVLLISRSEVQGEVEKATHPFTFGLSQPGVQNDWQQVGHGTRWGGGGGGGVAMSNCNVGV